MTILKEFDLDSPKIGDKAKRIQFRDEVRCMASLYERYFEKYETDDCWKVLVECIEHPTDSRILNFSGVYTVQVPFPIDEFFKSNEYKKKILTVEALQKGLSDVVSANHWEKDVFENAFNMIISGDYTNNWLWKKPLKSPTNEYVAQVFCEHNVSTFGATIIIKTIDNKEVKRSKVISERPNEFAYAKHLGKLKWLSENEVILESRNGLNQWKVSL